MNNRISGLFLAVIFLSGCTHHIPKENINYSFTKAENQKNIRLIFSEDIKDRKYTHTRGTDKWIFDVGSTIVEIFPEIFKSEYGSVSVSFLDEESKNNIESESLTISFDKFKIDAGIFQWSEHEAELTIGAQYFASNDVSPRSFKITSKSSDSGADEVLAYIPVIGNLAYDRALGVAMTTSILETAKSALVELKHNKVQQDDLR